MLVPIYAYVCIITLKKSPCWAMIVCECAVLVDNVKLTIYVFIGSVAGSYRINNITGGKFLSQIK